MCCGDTWKRLADLHVTYYFPCIPINSDAAGCIIYTDPIEDGEITVENGHLAYPDGVSVSTSIYMHPNKSAVY